MAQTFSDDELREQARLNGYVPPVPVAPPPQPDPNNPENNGGQFYWGGQPGTATEDENRFRHLADTAAYRNRPNTDYTGGNKFGALGDESRNGAADALTLMKQRAAGIHTASDASAHAATQNAIAQQKAVINSGRGAAGLAGSAQRGTAVASNMNTQAANNLAINNAQDTVAAQNALAQGAGQLRGMDANAQANEDARTKYINDLQFQQNQLNQQGRLGYENLDIGTQEAQLGAQEATEDTRYNRWRGETDVGRQNTQQNTALGVGAIGAGAGLAAGGSNPWTNPWSDERLKENVMKEGIPQKYAGDVNRLIQDHPGEVEDKIKMPQASTADAEMFDRINENNGPVSFDYRPEVGQPGRNYGVMAQDLEKSPMGASVVSRDAQGFRRVDTPKLTLANTHSLANVHARLNTLEFANQVKKMAKLDRSTIDDPTISPEEKIKKIQTERAEADQAFAAQEKNVALEGVARTPVTPENRDQVGAARLNVDLPRVQSAYGDRAATYARDKRDNPERAIDPSKYGFGQPTYSQRVQDAIVVARQRANAYEDTHPEPLAGMDTLSPEELAAAPKAPGVHIEKGKYRNDEETTKLDKASVPYYKAWLKVNHVKDADSPDAFYDYPGAYLAGASPDKSGHWPDTFKQHGHPTFSTESKWSKGPNDGGTWDKETGAFLPSNTEGEVRMAPTKAAYENERQLLDVTKRLGNGSPTPDDGVQLRVPEEASPREFTPLSDETRGYAGPGTGGPGNTGNLMGDSIQDEINAQFGKSPAPPDLQAEINAQVNPDINAAPPVAAPPPAAQKPGLMDRVRASFADNGKKNEAALARLRASGGLLGEVAGGSTQTAPGATPKAKPKNVHPLDLDIENKREAAQSAVDETDPSLMQQNPLVIVNKPGTTIAAHDQLTKSPDTIKAYQAAVDAELPLIRENTANSIDQNNADEAMGARHVSVAQARAMRAQEFQANEFHELQRKQNEIDDDAKALANYHEDPNRFWNSKNTAQKIFATIGMTLGGFVQGMKGGQNVALEMINKSTNDDLQAQMHDYYAQKDSLHAKNTAFGLAMEKYHDKFMAENVVRIAQNERVGAEIEKSAIQNRGVTTENNARALYKANLSHNAELKDQTRKYLQTQHVAGTRMWRLPNGTESPITQEQEFKLLSGQVGPQKHIYQTDMARTQGEEKRASQAAKGGGSQFPVTLPNGKPGFAISKDGQKQYTQRSQAIEAYTGHLKELIALHNKFGTSASGEAWGQAESLASQLQQDFVQAQGFFRAPTAEEVHLIKKIIPENAALWSPTNGARLQKALEMTGSWKKQANHFLTATGNETSSTPEEGFTPDEPSAQDDEEK